MENSNITTPTKDRLLLINYRGQILPMTEEQYQDFLESLREGEWD